MYVLLGTVVLVVGLLSIWQRRRLMELSIRLNKRTGASGQALSNFQSKKGYLFGAIFMSLAGAATAIYGLLSKG